MSAMSGDTTSVVPPRTRAGIWYVSDLPAPVGMTPMQSRPANTASMMGAWPGRNSRCPKTSRRTSRGKARPTARSDSATERRASSSPAPKRPRSRCQSARNACKRVSQVRRRDRSAGSPRAQAAWSAATSAATSPARSRSLLAKSWRFREEGGATAREVYTKKKAGPDGPALEMSGPRRELLRDLGVLDHDRVGVARPEVLVDDDDPLRGHHVAHRHAVGAGDGHVVVLLVGVARAVAQVEEVLPHHRRELHDLAAHRDRLALQLLALAPDLLDGAGVGAARLGDLLHLHVAGSGGDGLVLRSHLGWVGRAARLSAGRPWHPAAHGAAAHPAAHGRRHGGHFAARAGQLAEVDDVELAVQLLRLEALHREGVPDADLVADLLVGALHRRPDLTRGGSELEVAVLGDVDLLEHLPAHHLLFARRRRLALGRRGGAGRRPRRRLRLLASHERQGHDGESQHTTHGRRPPKWTNRNRSNSEGA